MATPKPKRGSDMFTDPDLVDRIFEYILELKPDMGGQWVEELKKTVRQEFAGQEFYIPNRSPTEKQRQVEEILRIFNGRNATEVARRLGIARATVYRTIKQAGRAAK